MMTKASLNEVLNGRHIILHSDNGSAMKGAVMLATLERLGVMPSFSRPRVSNDNPYAEAVFRTCKYRPEYPQKPFDTLDEARAWTHSFVQWYNHEHRHSALKFVTPVERHTGLAQDILLQRENIYQNARKRHPERWSGKTRNWDLKNEVWLNPDRSTSPDLTHAK